MNTFQLLIKRYFVLAIHWLSDLIFNIYHWSSFPNRTLQRPVNEHLLKSVTQLATEIRCKKVTSVEVVEAYISRIKDVNDFLNALVQNRFTEALEEAREIDKFIRSSSFDVEKIAIEKPILGVPFTMKELLGVKGLYCTSGNLRYINYKPNKDAEVVARARKAGGICLGVGNVPEMAMFWETSNTIYGTSNNPYDFRRTPGGSTGGDGALVAASCSPFAIGTDIAGSIRVPSFYNGIFGHMLTHAYSANEGMNPPAYSEEVNELLSTGPLTRFAADLRPLCKILLGDKANELSLDKKISLQDLKIYYMEDDGGNILTTPVEPEVTQQIHRIIHYFQTTYGVKSQKVYFHEIKHALHMCRYSLQYTSTDGEFKFEEMVFGDQKANIWWELVKSFLGIGHHTVAVVLACISARLDRLSPEKQKRMKNMIKELKHKMNNMLGDDGIFLYPPHSTTAPYHGHTLVRPYNHCYSHIFNTLQLPVSSCPTGLSTKRLPLGVQVVAASSNDRLCLQVAEEIEKALGGWICPSQSRQETLNYNHVNCK